MGDKELFNIIEKYLLEDDIPSVHLRELINEKIDNESIFYILKVLKDVLQDPHHHPEGDVLEHTLQVIDEAAKVREQANDKRAFMWAALLHDLGKEKTTMMRKGRWTAYNHDRVGSEMVRRLLREVSHDKEFNDVVCNLTRHHMSYLYITKRLPFGDIKSMSESTDINDVALLTLCDRLGRGEISQENKEKIVQSLNDFIKVVAGKTQKDYKLIELDK